MVNKVIFIGRLGKNAEVKTAQNNKEYVVFSLATSESWKNEKGDYENRTEWHRVYAWSNLSSFAKTLQKGQLITLEGKIKYREVSEEVEGVTFKRSIAEIHATSMKRLSKIEAADDPADGASEDEGAVQREPEIVSGSFWTAPSSSLAPSAGSSAASTFDNRFMLVAWISAMLCLNVTPSTSSETSRYLIFPSRVMSCPF